MSIKHKLLLFGLEATRQGIPQDLILKIIKKKLDDPELASSIVSRIQDLGNFTGGILSKSGPVTQAYGNYNPKLYAGINKSMTNTGVDIGVPTGTKVSAPQGRWRVAEATAGGYNSGYGNSVVIQNEETGEKIRFSHLSQVGVRPGETVQEGKVLGLSGATGNVTGPHVDIEYQDKMGRMSDFLKTQYAGGMSKRQGQGGQGGGFDDALNLIKEQQATPSTLFGAKLPKVTIGEVIDNLRNFRNENIKSRNLYADVLKKGSTGKDLTQEEKKFLQEYHMNMATDALPMGSVAKVVKSNKIAKNLPVKDIVEEASKKLKNAQAGLYDTNKYKNVDEFINSQGTLVHHGSDKVFKSSNDIDTNQKAFFTLKRTDKELAEIKGGGDYWSEDDLRRMPAQAFGENVSDFVVNFKNPVVVDAKGKGWDEIADSITDRYIKNNPQNHDGIILKNVREGFSGKSKLGSEAGIVDDYIVLDKSAIKTKSELADIYNQSRVAQPSVSNKQKLAEEVVRKELPVYKGEKDITSKILEGIKGKYLVNRQFIEDLLKKQDIKQAEKDIAKKSLGDEKIINIPDFAKKFKEELLPLSRTNQDIYDLGPEDYYPKLYDNVILSNELRGRVSKYRENLYESPIETSAGDVHFSGQAPNYFAHSRTEDLVGNKTRRVIELQSDLFQKGRLDSRLEPDFEVFTDWVQKQTGKTPSELPSQETERLGRMFDEEFVNPNKAKLKPYENTWHERIIREEVKKAAQDGKTKLQFPTGETAMKVEGLVNRADKWRTDIAEIGAGSRSDLSLENMSIGKLIYSENQGHFIITDVLDNGKFKAVPARALEMENDQNIYNMAWNKGIINKDTGEWNMTKALKDKQIMKDYASKYAEEFTISNKVDTENPIYKFYESKMNKYLTNKYNAKRVKDKQGVEWFEVDINSEQAKLPVEAFGIAPVVLSAQKMREEKNKKN